MTSTATIDLAPRCAALDILESMAAETHTRRQTMTTLRSLYDAMIARAPETVDRDGQWRDDLPTFGGDEPADTQEIWSWDATHLLVGACADELEIVSRSDW